MEHAREAGLVGLTSGSLSDTVTLRFLREIQVTK